jgi:hypothetical protein
VKTCETPLASVRIRTLHVATDFRRSDGHIADPPPVADYDAWRPVYDRVTSGPIGGRVRSHQILRGIDDPNLVVIVETYDSREDAA